MSTVVCNFQVDLIFMHDHRMVLGLLYIIVFMFENLCLMHNALSSYMSFFWTGFCFGNQSNYVNFMTVKWFITFCLLVCLAVKQRLEQLIKLLKAKIGKFGFGL